MVLTILRRIFKIGVFLFLFLICFLMLKGFAEEGRSYDSCLRKEFETRLDKSLEYFDYETEYLVDIIEMNEMPLTDNKRIRLIVRRALAKCGLADYSHEYALKYTITSKNNPSLICKAIFEGDHTIAITVEHDNPSNIEDIKISILKAFHPFKILWVDKTKNITN